MCDDITILMIIVERTVLDLQRVLQTNTQWQWYQFRNRIRKLHCLFTLFTELCNCSFNDMDGPFIFTRFVIPKNHQNAKYQRGTWTCISLSKYLVTVSLFDFHKETNVIELEGCLFITTGPTPFPHSSVPALRGLLLAQIFKELSTV